MLDGLLTGAVTAVVAALLSLALRSPDPVLFNSASVTLGALVAGGVAGGLHRMLPVRPFVIVWNAAFVAVAVGLYFGDRIVRHLVAFGLPLGTMVFALTACGVLVLRARRPLAHKPLVTAAALAIAIAVGLGFAGHGSSEAGSLTLPALAASSPGGSPRFHAPADLKGVTFVVGKGSRATFTVDEQVAILPVPNAISMRSTALTGSIYLDGRPSQVTLDLMALTSDQPLRDEHMQDFFRAHPAAVLTVPSLDALPERYGSSETVKRTVHATLAMNGVDHPHDFEVEARLDGSALSVLARTTVVWEDFGLRPPTSTTAKVLGPVTVEVLLAATPD